MQYSKTTGCFYPQDISYRELPDDLTEVSDADFQAAMARSPNETLDVANGKIVILPQPVPGLSETKVTQWQAIQTKRDHHTNTSGYKVGDKWFHSDPKSRNQQLSLVLLGENIPANLQWKTMDGSFVTMTPQLAREILAASTASDQAIFAAAEAHRVAMEASAEPASYDFSEGWPEAFPN